MERWWLDEGGIVEKWENQSGVTSKHNGTHIQKGKEEGYLQKGGSPM